MRLALGVVGGVIGGVVGGPFGASVGFSIGSALGAFLEPKPQGPTVEGPRLGDLTAPGGAEGTGIPILRGTVRVPGRVIWSTQIIETRTEEEIEEEGGKGGGGGSAGTSVTYSYSISFAVSLCDGAPSGVTGIWRIWADSKLIYSVADGADPATFVASSAHGNIRVYLGTETQLPDSLIVANVGSDDQSAFRGTCYLVFESLPLADFANHRPFIEAEVVFAGSPTYPVNTHTEATYTWENVSIDVRRNRVLLGEHTPSSGDWIYMWSGGTDAPVRFAQWAATYSQVTNIAVDEAEDEVVAFSENALFGMTIIRYDAATGALIGTHVLDPRGVPSSGVEESMNCDDHAHYDRVNNCFWSIGDGFGSGEAYLIKIAPSGGDSAIQETVWLGVTFADPGLNETPLIDGDGVVWLCGRDHLIRTGAAPEVFTLATATNQEKVFLWKSRGEVWIPRASGHGTDGFMVFNIAAETFSNSTTLGLGSWTTSVELGIENVDGRVWFLDVGATVDGYLRSTDGTLLESFTGATLGSHSLQYIPGVVITNTQATATSFFEKSLAVQGILVSDLVDYICSLAGADTVTVSSLSSDTCRGYLMGAPMPARGALEPLMGAFMFDGVEHDGVLTFVKRGGASVATLTEDDMGAMKEGSSEIPPTVLISRALESELPSTIYLRFANQDLDYNIGVARARRQVTETVNVVEIDFPITFNSEEGNQCVDRIMRYAWLEQQRFEFSLKPRWRIVEPTDVLTLPAGQRVRLTKVDYESNGPVRCEAVSDDDGALVSYAVGNTAEEGTGVTLGSAGATNMVVLDIPLLYDSDNDEGLYVGGAGESADWTSAMIYYSRDGGVTWQGATPTSDSLSYGSVVSGTMLDAPIGSVWDHGSVITVKLTDPSITLSSAASLETFYAGANALAIGTDGEDWEVVQYYDVTANADGTFTLKNFLRGRKGTERLTDAWTTGAKVVGLSVGPLKRVAFPLAAIGTDSLWRAVTSGGTLADAIDDEEEFNAVSATPYAPVEVGGAKQSNGDYQIMWTRRARKDHEWRNSVDVPLDETSEQYSVEITDEDFGTVYRTTTVDDATTLTYLAAELNADIGSPTPSEVLALGVQVYQISDRVGRGFVGRGVVGREVDTAMRFASERATAGMALVNSRHSVSHTVSNAWDWAPVAKFYSEGRWYWEVKLDYVQTIGGNRYAVGITNRTTSVRSTWTGADFYGARDAGAVINGAGSISLTMGDVVMIAWDATNGRVYFGKNGVWQNSANPAAGTGAQATYTIGSAWQPVVVATNDTLCAFTFTARFGQGHAYAIPTGFVPIN